MKPNYCPRCEVEGIADPGIPDCWVCPQCNGRLFLREISDTLQCREAVGAHGASLDTRGGLPARELAREVNERGDSSGSDVERGDMGQAKITRILRPAAPMPRDPGGEQKRLEERNVVQVLLPTYNELHGTKYESVESGVDEQGTDVIASSQCLGEAHLDFQITYVDTEGRLRASIARGQAYDAELSEEDLLTRFIDALRKKCLAPDTNAILVLDGGGIVTPHGTVERFVRQYQRELELAPFREVWWVDHAPGGVIRRLWPLV